MIEQDRMWSYTAYGLGIRSAVALPELLASEAKAHRAFAPPSAADDVLIRIEHIVHTYPIDPNAESYATATEEEAVLYWRSVGTFVVRNGREIIISPAADAEDRAIRLFLLGSVLGVLLHQRGHIALHASAVALHGGACLFVGASGWGKSTMGGILHARGHTIIADDIALIDDDGQGTFFVTPAFPRLKLWPESLRAVGHDPYGLPAIREGLEKRSLAIGDAFATRAFPLRRIYILSRGGSSATESITPITPVDALLELVIHAYGARLLRHVHTASHFQNYSRIACAVPIRRLTRQWSLDELPALAQAVEEDTDVVQ